MAARESAGLAERFLAETIRKQDVVRDQLTIHSDRGTSMASKMVALLLADLGVTKSHSRPHCSNDNPFQQVMVVPAVDGARVKAEGNDIIAEFFERAYLDGDAYRMASVQCPRPITPGKQPPNLLPIPLQQLDHPAWLGFFDGRVPTVRLLREGAAISLPGLWIEQAVTAFELLRTKMYTGAGRVRPLIATPSLEAMRH